MKIIIKAIMFISIAVLVVGGISTYFTLQQQKNIALSETEIIANVRLELARSYFDLYVDSFKTTLEDLSRDKSVIDSLKTEDKNMLNEISEKFTTIVSSAPTLEDIGLHGADCSFKTGDGEGIAALQGKTIDFSQRDYCKGVLGTKQTYISGVFVSGATGHKALGIAVPVKDGEGNFIGFVLGVTNIEELQTRFARLQEDSYTILLDRYGTSFVDTRTSSDKSDVAETVKAKLQSGNNSGIYYSEDNNEEVYNAYSGIEYATVISGVYKTRVQQLISKLTRLQLVGFVLTNIAMITIVLLLIWSKGKQIDKLSSIIKDISKGRLDTKIDTKLKDSDDEIGDLAYAFDRVLTSLKLAVEKVGIKKEEMGLGPEEKFVDALESRKKEKTKKEKNG